MRRPAWAELFRSGLAQTRAGSHRFEWFLNWASAGLGSLNWISMNSGGMNRISTGLASSDQASAGRHSCFCFECGSFPCCLFAQLWLRAPCYSRYSRLVVCRVLHVACVRVVCRLSRFACVSCFVLRVAYGRTARLFPTVHFRSPSSLHLRRNCVPISTFLAENCGCERF